MNLILYRINKWIIKSNSVIISGSLYVFLTVVEVGFEIDDDKDKDVASSI